VRNGFCSLLSIAALSSVGQFHPEVIPPISFFERVFFNRLAV
jgi:hypothetical protein